MLAINAPLVSTATHLLAVSSVGGESVGPVRVLIAAIAAQVWATRGPSFETKADIDAALDYPAGATGFVYGDADEALRGVYLKSGASGAGSWARIGPLPEADVSATMAEINALWAATLAGGRPIVAWETATAFAIYQAVFTSDFKFYIAEVAHTSGVFATDLAANRWREVFDFGEITAAAEAARDLAQGYAADAAAASGLNQPYASVASAGGATIAEGVKRISTQYYAPTYTDVATLIGGGSHFRMSKADLDAAAYPAVSYFRSVDTFMPNGGTDATNGGYWVLDVPIIDVTQLGAVPGADSDAAIQGALDLAAIVNRPVYAPPAMFLVDPLVIKSGVEFYGAGMWRTTLKLKVQASFPGAFGHNSPISNDVVKPADFGGSGARDRNITIHDICLDGDEANQTEPATSEEEGLALKGVEDCRVYNVRVINTLADGIDLDYCDRVAIENVVVDNVGKTGVHVSVGSPQNVDVGCNDIVVDGARITNCVANGINDQYVGGGGYRNIFRNIYVENASQESGTLGSVQRAGRDSVSENITIKTTTNTGFATGGDAVGDIDDDHAIISNIRVIDAGSNGIRIQSRGAVVNNIQVFNAGAIGVTVQAEGVAITGVVIDGAVTQGISITTADRVSLAVVSIRNALSHGVHFTGTNDHVDLAEVTLDTIGGEGILFAGTATNATVNGINTNTVTGSGIRCSGVLTNAVISNFRLGGCTAEGIMLGSTCTDFLASAGWIISPGTKGISIAGSCARCDIKGVGISTPTTYGIHINGRSDCTISDCRIRGGTRGIYVEGAASDNLIRDNKIRGSADFGINFGGSTTGNWIVNNDLEGSSLAGAATELVNTGTNEVAGNRVT